MIRQDTEVTRYGGDLHHPIFLQLLEGKMYLYLKVGINIIGSKIKNLTSTDIYWLNNQTNILKVLKEDWPNEDTYLQFQNTLDKIGDISLKLDWH